MKTAVVFLLLCFLLSGFDFGLCNAIPKTKFAPLPCWLVKRSRVYVCADSLYGDDERGVNDADQLSNEPIDVNKRLTEYFKQLVKQSEEITSFSYPDPSEVVGWLTIAIKRAMTAMKESSAEKRIFDSIGYHYRIGFGR